MIDIFFPAQERKPSLSVWTRLQFPHSKVFNLTNVICISCVMIATLPRIPCDYLFFFFLFKNPTQHASPTALIFYNTPAICGDDSVKDIMHSACCTSVIACFTGSTNQAVTLNNTTERIRNFALGPHHTPIFGKYPFLHLNRITISYCRVQ